MQSLSEIVAVQARVARVATGASATRRQGKGSSAAARKFLETLELEPFGTSSHQEFERLHDNETRNLRSALPTYAQSWGLARKLLNIFLRDALYTTYLERRFKLSSCESFLEIPLDSITAGKLYSLAGRRGLPRWPGVKHLQPHVSALYQAQAAVVAKQRSIARVHLDTFWWGERREKDAV